MISIVIPAYNEEHGISQIIGDVEALAADRHIVCEIVVVDDGSTDNTASVAEARGAKVLRHPHNLGYGGALKSGIRAATHDTILIMDADGTYPVAEIPRLLEMYDRRFDMVVGARSVAALKEPVLKTGLRMILTFLVEFTAGRSVPDVNSGMRVFSKRTVEPYLAQLADTFSFTTSVTLAYMMTSRFVTYVPIGYANRVGDTKVRLVRDALRTLQFIVQAIVFFNPLKIFLLLSAACFLAGAVLALFALAISSSTAAIILGCALVGAFGMFGLGLIADLLRQIQRS